MVGTIRGAVLESGGMPADPFRDDVFGAAQTNTAVKDLNPVQHHVQAQMTAMAIIRNQRQNGGIELPPLGSFLQFRLSPFRHYLAILRQEARV